MENFLPSFEIRENAAAAVSAGTLVQGAIVDMQNWDGVVFFCTIATANAGNYLQAQQGEQSNLSDDEIIAGSGVVAGADGDVVALEVHQPQDRYVRPEIVRAGANTATGQIYAIRYKGRRLGEHLNSVTGVIVSKVLNGADEGAAV